tara:strand:+ start:5639 stop:5842 length:204 start_codon:yes stop_codon:yes gene_type:complete
MKNRSQGYKNAVVRIKSQVKIDGTCSLEVANKILSEEIGLEETSTPHALAFDCQLDFQNNTQHFVEL